MFILNKRIQAIIGDAIVFYYAIFKWRTLNEDGQYKSFSFHKSSIYFFIFIVLIHEQALEFISFHYLLKDQVSPSLLMLVQIIHLYGIVYMIGDYKLIRQSRVKIVDNKMIINVGIRRTTEFELTNIETIREVKSDRELDRSPRSFWACATPLMLKYIIGFNDEVNCQITLKKQVKAYGFLGRSYPISKVNLSLDNCKDFIDTMDKLNPCLAKGI